MNKDFSTKDDIEKFISEGEVYQDQKVLVLELVRPNDLGVHTFDILTKRTEEGAKVLVVMLWWGTKDDSTHSASSGYIVDVEKEEIKSAAT